MTCLVLLSCPSSLFAAVNFVCQRFEHTQLQDKVKKVVDIWKKSGTFSSEAMRPCYARLSGEVPETDVKVKNPHSKRQCLLSSIPCFVPQVDRKLVWSATLSISHCTSLCGDVGRQSMLSQPPYASEPLPAPLKVVDPRYTEHARTAFERRNVDRLATQQACQRHLMSTSWRAWADQTASQKQFLVVSQYHTPASVCATEIMNVKLRRYSPLLFYPTLNVVATFAAAISCFGDDCATWAMHAIYAEFLSMTTPHHNCVHFDVLRYTFCGTLP